MKKVLTMIAVVSVAAVATADLSFFDFKLTVNRSISV